jgi:hypothetical protein
MTGGFGQLEFRRMFQLYYICVLIPDRQFTLYLRNNISESLRRSQHY